MWTVANGALVYIPRVSHTRTALGHGGRVLDTVTYINREA